jgi:hypothetical protein
LAASGHGHQLEQGGEQGHAGRGQEHDRHAVGERVAARQSLGGALAVSRSLPAPIGRPLAGAARHSFTDGMSVVFLAAAGVALLTALLELVAMPGRSQRESQLARMDESALAMQTQEAT